MARIALIAPTGMLGSAVYHVLKDKHELLLISRDAEKLATLDKVYGGVSKHKHITFDIGDVQKDVLDGFPTGSVSPSLGRLAEALGPVDAIINAAGIIKPHSLKDPTVTFFINGAFPHLLGAHFGSKIIQITTDCVYSGLEGAPYTEESPKSPNDLYGLSKALGEPADRSLVLRTSIIGPEIHSFVSLIAWVKNQDGKTVKGFTRHLWNGITTVQYAKIIDEVVSHRDQYPANGLFHIFSTDVTKYDMVTAIAKKYNVNVTVEPDDGPFLDRRLETVKDLCAKLHLPTFQEMLNELP